MSVTEMDIHLPLRILKVLRISRYGRPWQTNFISLYYLTLMPMPRLSVSISTGIGAGIILDKKLYRGMTGTAGEFGHTIVNSDNKQICTCGNEGCVMACACGLALPYLFKKKSEQGIKTTLALPADFNYSQVDGKLIMKGLEIGDPLSKAIIQECADYIGITVYNIFQIFNPPLIILGGGLTCWGEIYLT